MTDINTATETQLKGIPGIDEVTVSKILAFREENEVFVNKEELRKAEVPQHIYDRVKDHLECRPVEVEQTSRKTHRRRNHDDIEAREKKNKCKYHVGHIVAKANGGADHPDNYIPLPADTNMKLQHRYDDLMFAFAGKEQTADAVRISRKLNGYSETVQEAENRRQKAEKELKEEYPKVTQARQRALRAIREARLETDAGPDFPAELDLEKARVDQEYCEFVIGIWNELGEV